MTLWFSCTKQPLSMQYNPPPFHCGVCIDSAAHGALKDWINPSEEQIQLAEEYFNASYEP